ncbi:MAG: putative 2-aminoethylphosphonate ABC transporter ATP-binding protein [Rhodospirillales bacterium]|nr:putative 2-aminoethylphosphonate ABC transporter ATP-binding protein [Rhodospirillales bacterium]
MAVAESGGPYLRIQNVTKAFGDFTALREVSLDVHEGEFVCFLGPSGCGKTTLLRAIAGLDIQTSGLVYQGGADVSALPPSQRDFGIVFQSYALFPNLTVRRNVAFGLETRKMAKEAIGKRVDELLETVGLPDQGDKYPAQLSGGQQQRVALARALATSPGLLLLDEPLSALDAKVRVRLRDEIKALQRSLGVTTIMVTHDQEEALSMADRIVVMNQGYIEQVGSPLEIYRNPATAFVADFIGTMNFFPATAIEAGKVRLGEVDIACATGFLGDTPIILAIRPEDFVVHEGNGAADNAVEARVHMLDFLGSFYRATLVGPAFTAEWAMADLSVNIVRRLDLRQGSVIKVRMPGERLRVYAKN